MDFAAESTLDPLKHNLDPTIFGSIFARLEFFLANLLYYHNITSNTLVVLEAVADFKVKKLIYTSTCPTNEEPDKMRITEVTPQILQSPHKPSLSHDHVSSDLSVIDS
ncbi:unnamed protein product [Brassica oleracea var. botrytis]